MTTRALGIRATAPAASLAPSTVVLATLPASLPKFTILLPASLNVELALAACSSNQRAILPKKPRSSLAFGAAAPSCATASADVNMRAPANSAATADLDAVCLESEIIACLVPIAGQNGDSSVALSAFAPAHPSSPARWQN